MNMKFSDDALHNPSIIKKEVEVIDGSDPMISSKALSFGVFARVKPEQVSDSIERVDELLKGNEANYISTKNLPSRLFSGTRKLSQRI
jgi:hypothetical protein